MTVPTRLHGKGLYVTLETSAGAAKDISADVKEVTGLPGEVDHDELTGGGSTGVRYAPPGLQKATPTLKCAFNAFTDGAFDVVKDFQSDTATRGLVVCPGGNVSGYPKYTAEVWIKSVSAPIKTGSTLEFDIELLVDNGVTITTVGA